MWTPTRGVCTMGAVNEVTRILEAVRRGERQAAEELLPLVYDELRRIAAYKLAQESPGHTLQPTALVHEAWLRMIGDGNEQFDGRPHFFAVAAEAMRRILVESVRRKRSQKRGSGAAREELKDIHLVQNAPSEEILAIDDALDVLAAEDPTCAQLVKFRYFMGMTMKEAAAALGLPQRSAERLWTYSRAWLRRRIGNGP
jgi:RNA polymerase sigma factor (TIGR02999 family)